ncbi:cysteine synthase-like [Vanessa cardui]|uniref:cysteine synthase-like n=1 Tax=Vanessa cardui TaxID=171605 RepID=UPI001F1337BF|nr:cysteine synthase-like [Vanessa cardui]
MFNLINPKQKSPLSRKETYVWKSPYACKVHNSILDFVGNTPLVKLNRIPKDYGLSCEIYAKCEFMNPSGSSKDRIALAMLKDAEQGGYINDDTEFVEATSGNTGISVALSATLLGKKAHIIMSDKNSAEKVNTMRALGADVVVTTKSPMQLAREIKDAHPDTVVMLDQFENSANPKVHYDTTGMEIIDALGKVDALVSGVGTGGTLSGAGHRIKEKYPKCLIVVAEPEGSTMFNVHSKNHSFLVEGIGGSNIPIVMDKSIVSDYEVVSDEESFLMAREVIQKEGLLCGGSSGAIMAAAIKTARKNKLGAGHRIVVVLPDGMRNYMTKFVTDQWMEAHLFMDPPKHTMRWWTKPINDLTLTHTYPIITDAYTCSEALSEMKNVNIAIVANSKGWFVGAISKDNFRNLATNPTKLPSQNSEEFNFNDPVTDHLIKDCYKLAKNGKKGMPTIGLLSRMLDITPFVVIGQNIYDSEEDHFLPESVATGDDILDYIFSFNNKDQRYTNLI